MADELGEPREPLTVYQNCECIWWELERDGRELEVEACVVRPGEWCLINTPPTVVQQSYLDWIEGGAQPLDGSHLEARFRLLARTVVNAGWNLSELRALGLSLEDIFLQVTTAETKDDQKEGGKQSATFC